MTQTELRDFYEHKKSHFTAALKNLNQNINVVSNVRLTAALVFLAVLYFGFTNHYFLYTLPFILFGFIVLVRKHAALFDNKIHLDNLLKIQSNELEALNGNFTNFNTGAEFMNTHHPFTHDLDIFGEGSLFQYVNRITARGGKQWMADRLSSPPNSIDEIKSNQEAVRELGKKFDFRHEIQALGMQIDEQPQDEQQLKQWLQQPSFIYGKNFYRIILTVLPILTLSLVIAAIFIEGVAGYAFLAAGLQWGLVGFRLKQVNAFHEYISRKKHTLQKYAGILCYIRKENFSSALMNRLGSQAGEADNKINQLASLMSAFDARMNFMTNLVVNGLLLYDLQCVYRLEKWKAENASHLLRWLSTVREAEVLSSLGTFSFNHSEFIFPSMNEEQRLSAKDISHPLLLAAERISNDIHMDREKSVMIITGANMAGKSTFLRTLGVNVVLSLAGAPVCAREFDCPLIEMRSGMRTADSLKDHQSYFYAELDRLKSIMDELRSGKNILILLDEILKGTNSTDKQAGSVALVKQLVDHSCLVLIATHDLALGDLEKVYPGRIYNYCFEANIENEQLSFDYKLKPGLAQKMNATFLMKKMGIIV